MEVHKAAEVLYDNEQYRISVSKRFCPNEDLLQFVKLGKKYFNESRYPFSDTAIYTKAFAQEFLGYVNAIKDYIDDVCVGNIDDLQNKFRK